MTQLMRFLNWVIGSYLLALVILLHMTLLFCGQAHCVYPFQQPPVTPELGYQLRRAISGLLPFELKMMQTIAQWLVVGELMFVILYIANLVQKMLCYALWVLIAFAVAFGIVMYLSNNNYLIKAHSTLIENEMITSDQISNWTMAGRETWSRMVEYFK